MFAETDYYISGWGIYGFVVAFIVIGFLLFPVAFLAFVMLSNRYGWLCKHPAMYQNGLAKAIKDARR